MKIKPMKNNSSSKPSEKEKRKKKQAMVRYSFYNAIKYLMYKFMLPH